MKNAQLKAPFDLPFAFGLLGENVWEQLECLEIAWEYARIFGNHDFDPAVDGGGPVIA